MRSHYGCEPKLMRMHSVDLCLYKKRFCVKVALNEENWVAIATVKDGYRKASSLWILSIFSLKSQHDIKQHTYKYIQFTYTYKY